SLHEGRFGIAHRYDSQRESIGAISHRENRPLPLLSRQAEVILCGRYACGDDRPFGPNLGQNWRLTMYASLVLRIFTAFVGHLYNRITSFVSRSPPPLKKPHQVVAVLEDFDLQPKIRNAQHVAPCVAEHETANGRKQLW